MEINHPGSICHAVFLFLRTPGVPPDGPHFPNPQDKMKILSMTG